MHQNPKRNFIDKSRSTVRIPLNSTMKLINDESSYEVDSTSSKSKAFRNSFGKIYRQLQTVAAVDVVMCKEEGTLITEPIETANLKEANAPIAWKQVASLTKI